MLPIAPESLLPEALTAPELVGSPHSLLCWGWLVVVRVGRPA